jgi:hypothetical protein
MKTFWITIIIAALLIGSGLYFSTHTSNVLPTENTQTTSLSTVIITDQKRVIEDKKVKYKIDISEPVSSGHVNSASFNNLVTKLFSQPIDEFVAQSIDDYKEYKNEADKLEESAFGFELIGTARVLKDKYVSLIISKGYYVFYTAHPAHIMNTLLYDLDNQKVLELSDVFMDTNKALSYISVQSREQVINNLNETGNPDSLDESGLEPQEANFSRYTIDENGMTFIFNEYQVAPYSAGPQDAVLTWQELRPLLTPEFKIFAK